MSSTSRSPYRGTPPQRFIYSDGILYILLAIAAVIVGNFHPVPVLATGQLAVLVVNPYHTLLHLGIGIGWLIAARSPEVAKKASLFVGLGLGFLTILGFCNFLGFLGIGGVAAPDNFLHLCTSILAIYYGTAGAEDTSDILASTTPPKTSTANWY